MAQPSDPQRPPTSPREPVKSVASLDQTRCIDIVGDGSGRFTVKEFRRDPEDGGRWTLVADHSAISYGSEAEAIAAMRRELPWLDAACATATKA
jgi:hypothetical protein